MRQPPAASILLRQQHSPLSQLQQTVGVRDMRRQRRSVRRQRGVRPLKGRCQRSAFLGQALRGRGEGQKVLQLGCQQGRHGAQLAAPQRGAPADREQAAASLNSGIARSNTKPACEEMIQGKHRNDMGGSKQTGLTTPQKSRPSQPPRLGRGKGLQQQRSCDDGR